MTQILQATIWDDNSFFSHKKLGIETHTDRGSLRLSAVGETRELAFLIFDFLVGLTCVCKVETMTHQSTTRLVES